MLPQIIITIPPSQSYPFALFQSSNYNPNHISITHSLLNPHHSSYIHQINKYQSQQNIQNTQSLFIRRIYHYQTQSQYYQIKNKIGLLKKLKDNSLMVRLISILQGQNNFHLIYQYVQGTIKNLEYNQQNAKKVQQMLTNLFQAFIQIGIVIKPQKANNSQQHIDMDNHIYKPKVKIGYNKNFEIKYYLDIQDFFIYDLQKLTFQDMDQINNIYTNQIQQTLKAWYHTCINNQIQANQQLQIDQNNENPNNFKSSNTQSLLFVNNSYSTIPPKRTNSSSSSSSSVFSNINALFPNINPNKKLVSSPSCIQSNQKSNPFEILNMIEDRLEQLKRKTKYNPKMRQTFQIKQCLRQTVKQKWQKQKGQVRKFSQDTVCDDYKKVGLKKSNSNKQANQIKQKKSIQTKTSRKNSKHSHYPTTSCFKTSQSYTDVYEPKSLATTTKTIPIPSNIFSSATIITKANQKQQIQNKSQINNGPSSKNDFQVLKKSSFEKITSSKQKYVQQFLDILGDDNDGQNNNWQYNDQIQPIRLFEKKVNIKQEINENKIQYLRKNEIKNSNSDKRIKNDMILKKTYSKIEQKNNESVKKQKRTGKSNLKDSNIGNNNPQNEKNKIRRLKQKDSISTQSKINIKNEYSNIDLNSVSTHLRQVDNGLKLKTNRSNVFLKNKNSNYVNN